MSLLDSSNRSAKPKRRTMIAALICVVGAACGGDSDTTASDATVTDATTTTGGDSSTPTVDATTSPITDAGPLPDGATPNCTPTSGTRVRLQDVAGFSRGILVTAPKGDARLFVVSAEGRIWLVKEGAKVGTPFLDIRARVQSTDVNELGLLGLAFHPGFAANGRFFVYYTEDINGGAPYRTVVAEYGVTPGSDVASQTETRLLTQEQPQGWHNGGMMAFSPNDGYLYIGLGDGGDAPNSQDNSNLLGAMLRIDVDGAQPYSSPPDNPFVGQSGRDEIWTYGWRNPWRWSFDEATGTMFVGDVGDSTREEISVHAAGTSGGGNYGWPLCEGDVNNTGSCAAAGLESPLVVRDHANGRCSIIGGYVYRGSCMPDLVGTYIFGDFCSGEMWKLRYSNGVAMDQEDITSQIGDNGLVASFGQDGFGELYVISISGIVRKIVPE